MAHTGQKKRVLSAFLSTILIAASCLAGFPLGATKVYATTAKTKDNTTLGAWSIPAPTAPDDASIQTAPWNGSKVYFGKYNGNPVLYRMLAYGRKNTYGSGNMLLDCDSILFQYQFRAEIPQEPEHAHDWSGSDIKTKLNGDDFYGSNSVFTAAERNAIVISQGEHKVSLDGLYTSQYFWDYTPADDSHVFLLEDEDVLNTDYGYPRDDGRSDGSSAYPVASRVKNGGTFWWLRSPESDIYAYVCVIYGADDSRNGSLIFGPSTNNNGVSPAFNVDLSSVIFSTEVGNSTYKLTIKDDTLSLTAGEPEEDNGGYKVPVTLTSSGSTPGTDRISLLITDKVYSKESASIIEYQALAQDTDGSVRIELPANFNKSNKIYLVYEKINGDNLTDYAATPVQIKLFDDPPEAEDEDEEESRSGEGAPNPDSLFAYFITNGQIDKDAKIGKQVQGPLGQLAFMLAVPTGWKEAFTFNITVNDKANYTLKKGILSFRIPSQYLKAGRKFAILGLDKNGNAKLFLDTDTKADTITVNIDIEGYAFDLIYSD